ncbi:hypothetical protein VNO78_16705 [Psophocarpus tetragonolobus]|uniref:Uncharacterized protein n=1 Tax=Psophocarpus tetragonolobus TaxID=3891 RepID=A0AAN9SH10_PSOTE
MDLALEELQFLNILRESISIPKSSLKTLYLITIRHHLYRCLPLHRQAHLLLRHSLYHPPCLQRPLPHIPLGHLLHDPLQLLDGVDNDGGGGHGCWRGGCGNGVRVTNEMQRREKAQVRFESEDDGVGVITEKDALWCRVLLLNMVTSQEGLIEKWLCIAGLNNVSL